MSIRITVEDTEDPTAKAVREVENDVVVIVAGNHYIDGVTKYANGTQIYTIKVQKS